MTFISSLIASDLLNLEEIFDQRIFDLRDCSKFLARDFTVPDYCGVYALKKNLPLTSNGGFLRRRNRELPNQSLRHQEICDSQPCQREPLIVKVKVRKIYQLKPVYYNGFKVLNRFLPRGFKIYSNLKRIDIGECGGNCLGQRNFR